MLNSRSINFKINADSLFSIMHKKRVFFSVIAIYFKCSKVLNHGVNKNNVEKHKRLLLLRIQNKSILKVKWENERVEGGGG